MEFSLVAQQFEFTLPVEFFVRPVNHMCDVGAIEALAFRDENLRCDEFLGSQYPDLDSVNHSRAGAFNPRILYRDHSITHACDQVDKVSLAPRFREPHRIGDFTFHSRIT